MRGRNRSWTVGMLAGAALGALSLPAYAQSPISASQVREQADAIQPQVVEWRRHLHAHPELGFAEHETAEYVAEHLRGLGLEVRTGVAATGVIAILRGGAGDGPVVALRSDMDALPVREATGLPFASTATGEYQGATVPVAHACGHDAHMAMLMGAAQILAGMKDQLAGTIVFVFQPAEEGAPPGEPMGGAARILAEGGLDDPRPQAIFGLHVTPGEAGTLRYRPRGFMAASDRVDITLTGVQTHGAWPWRGVDVIAASANIINTINTLTARTVDPTTTPTVFTIATMNAGVRYNIIPDTAAMSGTLRTFDVAQRDDLVERATAAVEHVAHAHGAEAEMTVFQNAALVFNDPDLSAWLAPVLEEVVGAEDLNAATPPTTIAEDFSYYQQQIPGVFYHLGATPEGVDPDESPPNHSPLFDVNEAVLPVGVTTHVMSAVRFLERGADER